MKKRSLSILILVLLSLLLLAGCAMGPRAESTPGLAANKSHVFLTAANKIYKLDLESGVETWRYPADNSRFMSYAPVLLNDETFIYGDMYNSLQKQSIDAPSQKTWEFKEAKGWYQAKVAEANDVIIAPNTDRNIYAVNAKDGSLKWKHEDSFAFIAEPLIVYDTAIVSSQNHEILFLAMETGKQIASFKMQGAVIAKPFYLEETGLIYVGGLGHEFVAIDPKTHKEVWRYSGSVTKLSGIWAQPIVLGSQLVFNDDLGNIISVDPKTGKENWVLAEQGKMLAGLVALDNERFLVAGETGTIKAFDINRKPIFQFDIPKAKIYSTPIVAGDLVIIAPMGAEFMLYAYPLDLAGMPQWTFKPGK